MMRNTGILTWLSLFAWASGTIVLGRVIWEDRYPPPGAHGDVAAGLAGIALVMGFGIFVVTLVVGMVLGWAAVRRDPDASLPAFARGLNVVTLSGVMLSLMVLGLLSAVR